MFNINELILPFSLGLFAMIGTLIGVIFKNLNKQFSEAIRELNAAVQANTKGTSDLTSMMILISEKLEGVKRESSLIVEGIQAKLREHDKRHSEYEKKFSEAEHKFSQHKDKLHEFGNTLNQVYGMAQHKGWDFDSLGKAIFNKRQTILKEE